MTEPTIEIVATEEWEPLAALLRRCGLQVEGLADHLATTLVARDADRLVGSAALELYGREALLRSVAVDEAWRGRALGRQLVAAALDLARARGVAAVYLLTLTAAAFFERLGFERIPREEVPPSVQQSLEFRILCPATAIVMRRQLAS